MIPLDGVIALAYIRDMTWLGVGEANGADPASAIRIARAVPSLGNAVDSAPGHLTHLKPETIKRRSEERIDDDRCTSPDSGHEWSYTGCAYDGDDDSYMGEGRCYCVYCGADGDA